MAWTPKVLVDFDGVLHAYSRGWDDGTTYDRPLPGAIEAMDRLESMGYEIVIFSTRDAGQIAVWLHQWAFTGAGRWRITNVKEPAVCMVDDRAIRFTDWGQALRDVLTTYPLRDGKLEV